MKKIIYNIFSVLFILITPFLTSFCYGVNECGNDGDLLKCIFEPAKQRDSVIDFGDTKSDVGHTVLRESTTFSWGEGFYTNAPLIVRIVKIILRITVVLGVTMVIFYGVKFMLQVFKGDDYKSAGAKKDLINLFIGLLVALFSITAVNLVISIPKSSMTTGEDLDAFEVGCRINGNVYGGLEFKEYLCKNSDLGYNDTPSSREREYIKALSNGSEHMDDRAIGAYRCKVIVDITNSDSRKWIRIKNYTAKTECEKMKGQPVGGDDDISCKINDINYYGNDLKEYLCINSSLGYQDTTPSSREREYIKAWSNGSEHMDDRAIGAYRCKVIVDITNSDSRKWIRIKDNDVQTYCNELSQ